MVLYLIAVVAAAIAVFLLARAWWEPLVTEQARTTTGPAGPAPQSVGPPKSLEGVLVAQLLAGEITGGQYRRAIARVAARDDERHRMVLPPEIGPTGA